MGTTSDPIADLLTRIRNALAAEHTFIDVSHSKIKESITSILKKRGFIAQYLIKEESRKKTMRIFLKYGDDRRPVIRGLKRVSKPSLRVYVPSSKIPYVFGNMGISVLSTSKGVMEGSLARASNIGGELLCLVW
ncbi:30S ribosomal protein S8 [Chlamydiifrater phoenicopteri]|uniref:30S ribosomal protein S8 n=1 Tax=Chlamydiifrater phoenicopteri TaxID=2681469 RepID=UPI001BCC93CF|nr:30S ribosomal protein S8 [Chlamydiifrater phoenicopteri]